MSGSCRVGLGQGSIRQFANLCQNVFVVLQQVKAAAKAYRVYYTKTNDDPEDYLVDHSIIMYLLDPEGQFVSFYGKNYTAQELADNIAKQISRQPVP